MEVGKDELRWFEMELARALKNEQLLGELQIVRAAKNADRSRYVGLSRECTRVRGYSCSIGVRIGVRQRKVQ